METVIVVDVLRRAKWSVVLAGIGRETITASRGVKLVVDARWDDINEADFDVLILPGGATGTDALSSDERVLSCVRRFQEEGRCLAAICAAPLVLQAAGVLDGRPATCHPAVSDQLTCTARLDDRVVVTDRLVTSQGPGTAMEFALTLVSMLSGDDVAAEVRAGLVM
jgi:DJ-1 family protein